MSYSYSEFFTAPNMSAHGPAHSIYITYGQIAHVPHANLHLYTPLDRPMTTIYPQNTPKDKLWPCIVHYVVLRVQLSKNKFQALRLGPMEVQNLVFSE